MKPLGSEKLTGDEKIQRIIEIANFGSKSSKLNETKTEYSKNAVDGNTYAIVKENDGYYVKVGLNETTLDYVDGMLNRNRYRFNSYAGALKKINLMLKPLNEQFNEGKEDPVLNETKFVLKKPAAEPTPEPIMVDEPEMEIEPMNTEPEMGSEEEFDVEGLGDEVSDESEIGDEPTEDLGIGDDDGKLKKVQKLTGKLGQALREMKVDLDSSDIKYVLNSIISAVDLSRLDEEDLSDVMTNFEELENFEIESDEESSMDSEEIGLDDEEMDFDMEGLDDEMDETPIADLGELLDIESDEIVESDLDEGAFMDGLSKLGGKFVKYYATNPEGRKQINSFASQAVSKGTDKIAGELDKSDSVDTTGKLSSVLKDINPTHDNIDALGKMIFGDLNETDMDTKIDNVLGKYFVD